MATEFKRGKRVLCIDGHFESRRTDPFNAEDIKKPREGEIYTIREVIDTGHGLGLRLMEIENVSYPHDKGGTQEPCFSTERFQIVAEEEVAERTYQSLVNRIGEKSKTN